MNSLSERFETKDLYVVQFKPELINTIGFEYNGFINYFKPNLYYIVERFYDSDEKNHYETYKECIAGEDFYKRESTEEFKNIPDIFESIEPLSNDYLDDEEINLEMISTTRIFQIFQEINMKKIKRIGRR